MISSEKTRPNGDFFKKMRGIAIVCEYNPFHRGHLRQLRLLRESFPDACLTAVLAGNFVQRGEPAVLCKYKRAEAAVTCGADLVCELPFPWSAQGAGFYAFAAVSIASRLGCGVLGFGSETGSLSALNEAARRMESPEFADALRLAEKEDMSSPVSHINAVRTVYRSAFGEELPVGANDMLAVEYLRAVIRQKAELEPLCIKREGVWTATRAREYYRAGEFGRLEEEVPAVLSGFYRGEPPSDPSKLGGAVLNFFRTHSQSELAGYADLGGGIAGRLCSAALNAADHGEFLALAATKKYTHARLRRSVLSAMTGVTESDIREKPEYTSLLAANGTGTSFLREVKKRGEITVLTRPSDGKELTGKAARQFGLSQKADALWALAAGESPADQMRKGPYISTTAGENECLQI